MVNHHPAKFGGHRHCGSGDMFLVVRFRVVLDGKSLQEYSVNVGVPPGS